MKGKLYNKQFLSHIYAKIKINQFLICFLVTLKSPVRDKLDEYLSHIRPRTKVS